ncbi:T9SS type A sorting domain-containing protein [Flavobacterium sp. MAH-1]|uniref:T9SS type A sorting domain-containing protein n=1 Tax=Flavobacterium agri TaxID=2743471 RepID=A0A7Y8Y1C7_9FLAO|nr:T9SS type A sorting domain-containing protein [Flavobacterium agri]NUY80653.1 T9SS type A sorting domain-containing protein [Flavobacterium agri]NYA70677.1 T9SS type A sorting domain-containing protein [Flavobacterium agri]
MKQALLSFVFFTISLAVSAQCTAPTNLTVVQVTETSATLVWTETGNAVMWEIAIGSMGSPAPSANTPGIPATSNPFVAVDLECGYPYSYYVRSVCSDVEKSPWSGPIQFNTVSCGSSCFPPQEVHIVEQTNNSTTVTCSPTVSPSVEFLVQLSWAPPPTPAVPPTASSDTFPFTMPVTECGNLSLWYRSACNASVMWEGPISLRTINMQPSLGTIYGCVVNDAGIFHMADIVPLLPEGDVHVFVSLDQVINPNTQTEVDLDTMVYVPTFEDAPTYYAVVSQDGCDDVYPIQFVFADTCQGFRLEAFLDENVNGTKDVGEGDFPMGKFTYAVNDGTQLNGYTQDGTYFIYEANPANTYDFGFDVNPAYASLYSTSTTYSNVSATDQITVLQFPVTTASPFVDAAVTIVSTQSPMPGFMASEVVTFSNHGTQTITSGTLTYTKDAAIPVVSATSQGTITHTATGFTLDFTNLHAFETRSVTITYTVPTIPTVQLGQQLHSSVSIASASDINTNNNIAQLTQNIIGSMDPNDKMEAHGPQILHSSFSANDYLYYTIRFENTGTAAAHNIRIEDVLDSQLNEETVELLSSSDHCTLTRNGNSLVFNLPNVMLPPSVENTQIGHGYVQFRVKPDAGYQVNDVIPNTASIYFDFNPAIVTNEWTTTFVNQLQVDEFDAQSVAVYPNPTSNFVTVALKNGNVKSARVYDVSGKIVAQSEFSDTIDLSKTTSGMYFLEILTDSNQKFTRKLLKK